jgi:hypothetical protein
MKGVSTVLKHLMAARPPADCRDDAMLTAAPAG